MFSYSIVIGVIAGALLVGLAHDEKVYASVICMVNIIKIYRNNCGVEAPHISGHLRRLFFVLKRCPLRARKDNVDIQQFMAPQTA